VCPGSVVSSHVLRTPQLAGRRWLLPTSRFGRRTGPLRGSVATPNVRKPAGDGSRHDNPRRQLITQRPSGSYCDPSPVRAADLARPAGASFQQSAGRATETRRAWLPCGRRPRNASITALACSGVSIRDLSPRIEPSAPGKTSVLVGVRRNLFGLRSLVRSGWSRRGWFMVDLLMALARRL
jgi:hypothetical protein